MHAARLSAILMVLAFAMCFLPTVIPPFTPLAMQEPDQPAPPAVEARQVEEVSAAPACCGRRIPVPASASSPPPPQGVTTSFEWWNTSWHYRIRLDVNATSLARFNVTVPVQINITEWLETLGVSGENADGNSPRVVEQDPVTGAVIVEQPSVFFRDRNWNAAHNATGWILFFINGSMPAKSERTFFIYFDTVSNGPKSAPSYPQVVHGWFSQYYGHNGGGWTMPSSDMYLWKNLDTTCYQIAYHDGSGNNFPPGADGPSPDWERFSANYTTWLFVEKPGTYGFQTSSDDGSWLYVDDALVVNNGGLHSTRTISATKYLTAGLHSIWVPWYENGGAATIYVRWDQGAGYVYLTGDNVTTIKFGTLMDMDTPCSFTWGSPTGIFLVRVHVEDKGGASVEGTLVELRNATNPTELFDTGETDIYGNCSFSVVAEGDYFIMVKNETAYPTGATSKIWVNANWTFNLNSTVEGELVDHTVVLPLATVTYTVYDLEGELVASTAVETARIYVFNDTYPSPNYLAFQDTDSNGKVTFTRLPVGMYNFSFSYTNTLYPNDYNEPDMPNNESMVSTSYSHRMILPLCDMTVHVYSYDGKDVPDVSFQLTSLSYSGVGVHAYSSVTNGTGYFTFQRILNGTWTIHSFRSDTFGQNTENITWATIQGGTYTTGSPFLIKFPLDTLKVLVQDLSGNVLAGANVTVWTPNWGTLVTQASTDKNGYVEFAWICNQTYWLNGSIYEVYANYTLNNNTYGVNLHNVRPDWTTWTIMRIDMEFQEGDTVFYLDNSTIIYIYYNTNFTIHFRFVAQKGNIITALNDTEARWVNFTLTHSGFVTITGTWNYIGTSYNVWFEENGYWHITINTTQFLMDASTEPYVLSIDGYAVNGSTPFNQPETLVILIYVLTTPTDLTGPSTVAVTWGEYINFNVTYTDTNHSLPVVGALVSYTVEGGGYTRPGTLIDNMDGTYWFHLRPIASELNLPNGTYTITITATLSNYETKVIVISLTINAIPTTGDVEPDTVLLTWSNQFTLTVNYSYSADGTPVTGAQVYVVWGNVTYYLTYNATSHLYEVVLAGWNWTVGGHPNIRVFASLGNHTGQALTFDATIQVSPTSATDPPDYPNQDWGCLVSFLLTYTDLSTSTSISGGLVMLNWSSGYWWVVDNGDGTYNVTLDMSIAPGTYKVELQVSKYGYTSQTKYFDVDLLVPLQVESTTDWMVVYWTQSFYLDVLILNGYTSTNETGANVEWRWGTNSGIFVWLADIYTSQNPIPATMFGKPGEYIIEIVASKVGASTTTGYIYVTVMANPTSVTTTPSSDFDIYYGETGEIVLLWNDTFEGVGVGGADTVTITVYYGNTLLGYGSFTDYGNGTYLLRIPTATLGMDAGEAYTITITVVKNGYEQGGPISFTVQVLYRPTTLQVNLEPSIIEVGTHQILIIATYTDDLNGTHIFTANLTCGIVGFSDVFVMEYDAETDTYRYLLTTGGLAIQAYQVWVRAELDNFEEAYTTTLLTVIERGINVGPIRITLTQMIFWAAGIALAILGFAGYVGYKRATLPYQIKCMNKALRAINANRPAKIHPEILSREEAFNRAIKEAFKRAGLDLPEKGVAG